MTAAASTAVTNGTSGNQTFNDNERLAYYGRVGLHWGNLVSLGGGVYYNDVTLSDPNLDQIDNTLLGVTADLKVKFQGLFLMANLIQRTATTRAFAQLAPNASEVSQVSRAVQVQAGYLMPFFPIMPTYRISSFDPSASYTELTGDFPGDDPRTRDAVVYQTIGLNYLPATYPVTLMVNYTLTGEEAGAEIANNRFEALVQLNW